MRISTKGRYGTRVLLELALHQDEGLIPLKEIARKQDISLSYLEHLITPLVNAGIVKTSRGPRGGVSLIKQPQEIRLSEVILLFEGSVAPVECVINPDAYPRSGLCVAHEVWKRVQKAINGVLESTTMQDLVERQKNKWNNLRGAEGQRPE